MFVETLQVVKTNFLQTLSNGENIDIHVVLTVDWTLQNKQLSTEMWLPFPTAPIKSKHML